MASKKNIVVDWKDRTPWRLGPFWFTYGPNEFTRAEYCKFEIHPLFLRQVSLGKVSVRDPEHQDTPKAEIQPETIAQPTAVTEGDDSEDGQSAKKKSRRRDSEPTPS